jgi:LPXTG-site transpeptidase (sortase) family protein
VIEGHTYKRWSTADNLVAWHNLSARLGKIGNTVLNGHSDVSAEVFRNLSDVRIGDEVIVFSGNKYYRYTVTEMTSVKEKGVSLGERIQNARWIAATQDERLTLVTCANPGASHRLIVVARPLTN